MVSTRWPGRWFRFDLRLPAAAEEQALARVQLGGSRGAVTQPAGPGRISITAWFDERDAAENCLTQLEVEEGFSIDSTEIRSEEDSGWLDASLTPRPPIQAGRFMVVDGSGEPAQGQYVVELPVGRAFGTGEHETTRLCLELLDRHFRPRARVFDLGTGSGILAIAAAKAGAEQVLALDNDPAVLEVVEENVALNRVGETVEVGTGSWADLEAGQEFDLVLANIHRTALIRAAGSLSRVLAPGAVAILSGFGPTDAPRVRDAWQSHGFELAETVEDGQWAALALSRGGR